MAATGWKRRFDEPIPLPATASSSPCVMPQLHHFDEKPIVNRRNTCSSNERFDNLRFWRSNMVIHVI
jgi:hypothetical protein